MFKDFIKEGAGVEIYPVISLLIFVLFFTGLLIQAILYKKDFVTEMSMLPLDIEEKAGSINNQKA